MRLDRGGVRVVQARINVFRTDFYNDAQSDVGLNLGWLRRLNGVFVDQVVVPYFAVFGWLIFRQS